MIYYLKKVYDDLEYHISGDSEKRSYYKVIESWKKYCKKISLQREENNLRRIAYNSKKQNNNNYAFDSYNDEMKTYYKFVNSRNLGKEYYNWSKKYLAIKNYIFTLHYYILYFMVC